MKFGSFDANGNDVEHDYGNLFYREPCGTGERLVIGPSDSHIKRLDELSSTFPTERFYVLYVLLLSHAGREPGRYQSPLIESHEDLQVFLWSFQEFFEGDGRHHVWVASADGPICSSLIGTMSSTDMATSCKWRLSFEAKGSPREASRFPRPTSTRSHQRTFASKMS